MPYSDWFRRVASGREAGRPRARRVRADHGRLGGSSSSSRASPSCWSARERPRCGPRRSRPPARTQTVHPAPALQVTSVTPGSNSRDVNGTSPIRGELLGAAGGGLGAAQAVPLGGRLVEGRRQHRHLHPRHRVPRGHHGDAQHPGRLVRGAVRGRGQGGRGRLPGGRVHPELHHRLVQHPAAGAAAGAARLPAADVDAERDPGPAVGRGRASWPPRTTRRPAASAGRAVTPRCCTPSGPRAPDNIIVTGAIRAFQTEAGPDHGRRGGPGGLVRPAQGGRRRARQRQRLHLRAGQPVRCRRR